MKIKARFVAILLAFAILFTTAPNVMAADASDPYSQVGQALLEKKECTGHLQALLSFMMLMGI